eukprot:3997051-Alexandrium_andersonii.AAC.1
MADLASPARLPVLPVSARASRALVQLQRLSAKSREEDKAKLPMLGSKHEAQDAGEQAPGPQRAGCVRGACTANGSESSGGGAEHALE